MNTRGNLGNPLKSLPTKDEDELSKRRKPFQAGSPERAKKEKKKKKIDIFRKGKESWSIEASWMRQRAEESKEGGTPRNCLN